MKRLYLASLATTIVGLGVLAIQIATSPRRALFAYIGAFGFGVTVAVSALILVMIMNAAHAEWFVAVRRVASAIAATLPLYLVLFIPIAVSLRGAYPWTHPADYPDDVRRILEHQRWYLNAGFFLARAYGYMGLWTALSMVLRWACVRQDTDPRYSLTALQRRLSAAAIPVMAITLTLASYDWFVSLVPALANDVFGMYIFSAGLYGAIGALAIGCALAWRAGLFPSPVGPMHFLAIGRVMLTATMLWLYMAFFMLLIIWIANLPHEVIFYVERTAGAWWYFIGILVFGHFGVAFSILVQRWIKLRPMLLGSVGVFLVLMHGVDLYWVVVPSGGLPSVLDFGAFLAVLGVAFAFGLWRFSRACPVPMNDPFLPRALAYESP